MELKSFGKKTLIFIACIFVGALASNAALLGIFMTQGLEINSTTNISDIFSNEDVNLTLVKIGVGFNHLILFVGTAALFWWLIKENTFSFRGIVQKELHRVIANPHLVIFITSVIFSGIHLQAAGFLPKFLISYILCYSYYWGKSLIYPMILHFINNGSMTLALYFMDDELMDMDQANTPEFPWAGVIISIILCILLVRMIKANIEAENGPEIAA